ncbi:MAG TPA: hypothetical protein VGF48_17230 [Thermoanaerobaculia bacterium]|jgi:hypothetical protein
MTSAFDSMRQRASYVIVCVVPLAKLSRGSGPNGRYSAAVMMPLAVSGRPA